MTAGTASRPMVISGAVLRCSFGAAASALVVPPANRVLAANAPAATIMDKAPLHNIMPFGLCRSPSNPDVAAATAAAGGVLTPRPCAPVFPGPWTPRTPAVTVAGVPALGSKCTLMCAWAGVVSVVQPGQFTVTTAP